MINDIKPIKKKSEKYDGPPVRIGSAFGKQSECASIELYQCKRNDPTGPFTVHGLAPEGDKVYPRGLWKIEYRGELVRYLDADQLRELCDVLTIECDEEKFEDLAKGIGVEWGPARNGTPMDKMGRRVEKYARDLGDWGDMAPECEWIETFDPVLVSYEGSDVVWPDGCWAVTSMDEQGQLLDKKQLSYVAHTILGMPFNGTWKKLADAEKKRRVGTGGKFESHQLSSNDFADLDELFGIPKPVDLGDLFDDPEDEYDEFSLDSLFDTTSSHVSRQLGHSNELDDLFADPLGIGLDEFEDEDPIDDLSEFDV